MKDKLVVVGSLNYDIIFNLERLPALGETLAAEHTNFCAGGKGANQAVQAAKLGALTYMVGCVGTDSMGDFLVQQVLQYGVHTEYIQRTSENTGLGVVQALTDGSVYATISRGANYKMTLQDIDGLVPLLQEAKIVILQMEIPIPYIEHAIMLAKSLGCYVILNTAPAMEIESTYLNQCDCLVMNEVEASFYAETQVKSIAQATEITKRLAHSFSTNLVVTLGQDGAIAYDGKKAVHIPSLQVKAVETTGAGDSFIGALGYCMMQDMNLIDACRFATKCSAVTVCNIGAQNAMPTLKDLNNPK